MNPHVRAGQPLIYGQLWIQPVLPLEPCLISEQGHELQPSHNTGFPTEICSHWLPPASLLLQLLLRFHLPIGFFGLLEKAFLEPAMKFPYNKHHTF